MFFHLMDGKSQSIFELMVASGVLYAGSRLAMFALARPDGSDPGRRAMAQWFPIAATVIAAILWRTPDPQLQTQLASVAVSVIFGSSVACLSLVPGMTTYLTPMDSLPPSRKVWPFVLPAALLTLMAGFSAHLTWWHGLMLLALGGSIVPVWIQSPEGLDGSSEDHLAAGPAIGVIAAALALCAGGAYLGVSGTLASSAVGSHNNHLLTPGTLGAVILSPLLVLPTLSTASSVAQRGYPGRALTALVGTVLLNLCVLLPVTIFLWYFKASGWTLAGFRDFKAPWESTHALPFDMAAWRIENVILLLLGFAMVPVSMGRWAVGRLESTLLVAAYAGYIVVLTAFGLEAI